MDRGTADSIRLTAATVKADPKRLDRDEVRLLAKTVLADAADGHGEAVVVLVAVFTGCHRSEALGLRTEDVDAADGTAEIRRSITELRGGRIVIEDTKSRYSKRTDHLPAVMLDVLPTEAGWVAPTRDGGVIRPTNLSRYLRAAAQRAGIGRGVGSHELRRSFTDALDQGTNVVDVSRSLGHSDVRFVHDRDAGRRGAAVLGVGRAVADLYS